MDELGVECHLTYEGVKDAEFGSMPAFVMKQHPPIYRQERVLASGIPLGGLGTGSVEIRADGQFHDWEIFNNHLWSGNSADAPPDMTSDEAFFALRTRGADGASRVRLLHIDDQKSQSVCGWYDYARIYNYPFLRNVAAVNWSGQHPFARLQYEDETIPVEIGMEAFTPFIPFAAKDSGLPLAFFVFRLRNTSAAPCEASLLFNLANCAGYDLDAVTLEHRVLRSNGMTGIRMGAEGIDPAHRTNGSMVTGVLEGEGTVLPAWTGGRGLTGFPNADAPGMSQFWYPFRDTGDLAGGSDWKRSVKFAPKEVAKGALHGNRQIGRRWNAAVARKLTLGPDEEREVVFFMAWFFPNHHHYFTGERLGHMYENWFADAAEVAGYGESHFARLRDGSRKFADHLYRGLDPMLAASLNAQLTTFPQSYWWTRDGDLTAWEGSCCCQTMPNCHTPWSSFQPLLFFPDLYLKMKRRMAAFHGSEEKCQGPDCGCFLEAEHQRRQPMTQATKEDLGGWFEKRWKRLGYSDEDFSLARGSTTLRRVFGSEAFCVQLLRDVLWTGDEPLLRELWPLARGFIEGDLARDKDGDGLPDGAICFLTYDHWFLPATNCYKGTMWLAELAAGAEIAERIGETETAKKWREVLRKGALRFEELYWNGEYYRLCQDQKRGVPDEGCLADQVSGHLYLRLCGLGGNHDEARIREALRAVLRFNLKPEEGLLNGSDPHGRDDWRWFARFSERGEDEALSGQWVTPWTGTEYYVAATMIAEGLVDEGMAVVKNVYDRHAAAGMLLNHMECGEHYFRAAAVWALLPALQGLVFDAGRGELAFAPKMHPEDSDTPFILPGILGRLVQQRTPKAQKNEVRAEAGEISLHVLRVEVPKGKASGLRAVQASCGDSPVAATWETDGDTVSIRFAPPLLLDSGRCLAVTLEW